MKPYADLFLCTASMLGVEPENCIAIIEDGEAGIHSSGTLCQGVCSWCGMEQMTHQANAVFPSLENVRLIDLQNIYAACHAESAFGEFHEMERTAAD